MSQSTIEPLKYRPGSANIVSYGERDEHKPDRVWASCTINSLEKVDGVWQSRRLPTYSFTVYQMGKGEIGRFVYEPKTRPNPIAILERTATRLVREFLRGERGELA